MAVHVMVAVQLGEGDVHQGTPGPSRQPRDVRLVFVARLLDSGRSVRHGRRWGERVPIVHAPSASRRLNVEVLVAIVGPIRVVAAVAMEMIHSRLFAHGRAC